MDTNIIIHGDCIIEMQKIPDKSIDFICCDLPYGILNRQNKAAVWDKVIPLDILWQEYERIIKDNGAIALFGQGMFTANLMMSNPKIWRYNLIWDKVNRPTGFLDANRKPLRIHEDICIFYKSQPIYNPQFSYGNTCHKRGSSGSAAGKAKNGCYGYFRTTETTITNKKYPTSVIRVEKEHSSFLHSTQKPVELIAWLIRTYTKEGDIVLDNTAGSMTTAVAAMETNRRYICIEKDDDIFQVGKTRVEKFIENKKQRLF